MKKKYLIVLFILLIILVVFIRENTIKHNKEIFKSNIPNLSNYKELTDNICFYSISNEFGVVYKLGFFSDGHTITIPVQTNQLSFLNIISSKHFQFESDGSNSMFERNDFPVIYDVILNDDYTNLEISKVNKYFDRTDIIACESSKDGTIDRILYLSDGLKIYFSPLLGNEANFYAAYTDVPSTNIEFDDKYLKINLANTNIKEKYSLENKYDYSNNIKQITLNKTGESSQIIIEVSESVNYFQLDKSLADENEPYLYIKFFESKALQSQ
jgi:hypothetical protein